MKFTQIAFALAALVAAATSAHADQLEAGIYDNPGYNSINNVAAYDWELASIRFEVPSGSVSYDSNGTAKTLSGPLAWKIGSPHPYLVQNRTSNTSFIAFCFDFLRSLTPATSYDAASTTAEYTSFTSAADASAYLSSNATDTAKLAANLANAQRLFDLWGNQVTQQLSSHVTPPSAAAGVYGEAMQLALWELTTENNTSIAYDVSTGNFRIDTTKTPNPSNLTDIAAITALANQMLADVQNASLTVANPSVTTLWVAPNNGSQMLIQSTAVIPEPATYALVLAGLGVVGLSLRRRNAA